MTAITDSRGPQGQMQEIEQHERRLSAALLRIGAALERMSEPPPAGQVLASARTADDTAAEVEIARLNRLVGDGEARLADLGERLSILRERHEATTGTLETRIRALNGQIDAQGVEMQRLRMINVQLREALRGLREALTAGAADAGQINRAMQAELESLRTARQIEVAELDALLAALDPFLVPAEPAPETAPEV